MPGLSTSEGEGLPTPLLRVASTAAWSSSGRRKLRTGRRRVYTPREQGMQRTVKHGEGGWVGVPYFVHCPADEITELASTQQRARQRGGVRRRLFVQGGTTFPSVFLSSHGLLQDIRDRRMDLPTKRVVSRAKSIGGAA